MKEIDVAARDRKTMRFFGRAALPTLAATAFNGSATGGGGSPANGSMVFEELAPSTSAITYKLRVGGLAGITGTVSFNGTNAARMFGGTMAHTLVIEEITP